MNIDAFSKEKFYLKAGDIIEVLIPETENSYNRSVSSWSPVFGRNTKCISHYNRHLLLIGPNYSCKLNIYHRISNQKVLSMEL